MFESETVRTGFERYFIDVEAINWLYLTKWFAVVASCKELGTVSNITEPVKCPVPVTSNL